MTDGLFCASILSMMTHRVVSRPAHVLRVRDLCVVEIAGEQWRYVL